MTDFPLPKIGIDAHMVGERETGNETYIVELADALAKLGHNRYNLYSHHPEKLPTALRSLSGLRVRRFSTVPSAVRIAFLYPKLAARDNLSILHMTYIAPPVSPCPIVLTVHDVSYRVFPQFFSTRDKLVLGSLVGFSMRRAARIITISEHTKNDIARYYRIPKDRIVVTPLAAGGQFTPQPEDAVRAVREKYSLAQRYILAVGNVQPRKNLTRLIGAFTRIAELNSDVELVIVGRSTWAGSEVDVAAQQSGYRERIRFTGYVPDSDLPALYSGAEVFCYPSLYEGFGLPPLEAMQCGTPTVVSNVASLPEVVADAGILVDPYSISAITDALQRLLQDEHLRHSYIALGLARARQFTWEHTAQLTSAVYSSVLRSKLAE